MTAWPTEWKIEVTEARRRLTTLKVSLSVFVKATKSQKTDLLEQFDYSGTLGNTRELWQIFNRLDGEIEPRRGTVARHEKAVKEIEPRLMELVSNLELAERYSHSEKWLVMQSYADNSAQLFKEIMRYFNSVKR